MANRTKKNLLGDRDIYNRYYGGFRGVDFSSDHTQVHPQRLAYMVNMYKDYRSGQGNALETVAGFRRRVVLPESEPVYGIHTCKFSIGGAQLTRVLIHAGEKLYLWRNFPLTMNVEHKMTLFLSGGEAQGDDMLGMMRYTVTVPENVESIVSIARDDGTPILTGEYDASTHILTVFGSDFREGDSIYIVYREGTWSAADTLFSEMNSRRSTSFIMNNRLYIVDGKNYLVYDGEMLSSAAENGYIPTTYINVIPSGENQDAGARLEQRNILQPKFKMTFIADGSTKKFFLNDAPLDAVHEVKVYGELVPASQYTVNLQEGSVTFSSSAVPQKPESKGYELHYAGVEITAEKAVKSIQGITSQETELENAKNLITACTLATVFDNRVFLSGNPMYPNHIFYCCRNSTGYADPTYFGILCYMQDGVGNSPITGMIPVASTLMVLKNDTQQDGSTYFHSGQDTGENYHPRIYPSEQGLAGVGCLGACVNFLDDPVFVSRLGLEAIGQLSVRNERAVEHRSSLIDAKFANLDLRGASLTEWEGYLAILVDGKIFLADNRQRYTHTSGVIQYEWYYLENIGVYEGQYPAYTYARTMYQELEGKTISYCRHCGMHKEDCSCEVFAPLSLEIADAVYNNRTGEEENLTGTVANLPDENGREAERIHAEILEHPDDYGSSYRVKVLFRLVPIENLYTEEITGYRALLCEDRGGQTGGTFRPAVLLKTMEDNLFFGTENGVLCSFNFDMRDEDGNIAAAYYTFDDRAIVSGCATRMDSCDIPHLVKTTVKKSTVIKTKTLQTSAAKVMVRTNKIPYKTVTRINSTLFSFENMDFADFSFETADQSLFVIREKEKKWVEKQYYIYSDEFMKPFALDNISFRYYVSGRYKE